MDLRCQGDEELRGKLLKDRDVARVVESAREAQEIGIRRHLLSTAVRITDAMAPKITDMVEQCRNLLGVQTEIETYVMPSPVFNAGCYKPEGERVFLMLSSGLLEAFDADELRFVVGHELGHHLFDHHEIPIGVLLKNSKNKTGPLALKLFAWSRYAEISADRAGFVCAADIEPVASAFFKLASGLTGDLVQMRADDLIEQLGDIRQELERQKSADAAIRMDWFSTHPFSPLRLRAAKFFAESSLYREGGNTVDSLEGEVHELMALMEPSYLESRSDEAELMRRLLFSGGFWVADTSDGISDEELELMERLLGAGRVKKGMDVDAIKADVERRARDVKEEVPRMRRVQVIRDLCLIALADGHAKDPEREVLYEIAKMVEIDVGVVDRTLENPPKLD